MQEMNVSCTSFTYITPVCNSKVQIRRCKCTGCVAALWAMICQCENLLIFGSSFVFREPLKKTKREHTGIDSDELDTPADDKPAKTETEIMQWLQSLFLFSLCWSVGGNLDTDSRLKFSDFVKVLAAGTNKQHQRLVIKCADFRADIYGIWIKIRPQKFVLVLSVANQSDKIFL